MIDLNRLLNTIGKGNFVQFYEDYQELSSMGKNIKKDDKLRVAKKLLANNPNASEESGQITRINAAIRIFNNGLEKLALKEILNSHNSRITEEIKNKAKKKFAQL